MVTTVTPGVGVLVVPAAGKVLFVDSGELVTTITEHAWKPPKKPKKPKKKHDHNHNHGHR